MARDWTKAFLANFRLTGNVTIAADAAKVFRSTVYARRESDKAFAAAMDDAQDEAGDRLEMEARRRAETGVDEPVYGKLSGLHAGEGEIGTVRKYSDTLLIFLLKGAKPEKYRERQDVTSGGKPVTPVALLGIPELKDDELDRRIADAERGEITPPVHQ